MPLTDAALRALKPAQRARRIADGGGLFIEVSPSGGKLWRIAYRVEGRQKLLALGSYPTVSLADARAERERAKKLLRDGIDPSAKKKLDKITAAVSRAATFSVIAAELLDKKRREGRAAQTLVKTQWLHDLAEPHIGSRPIAEISAPEVLQALRAVEARGKHETARRLRSVIGEVFRYAIATGRASTDPTFALRGALTAPTVVHRAAITTPKAFGGLLRAIDGFDGQPTTLAALQLLALLFPRPGELRLAEWTEFDLDKAVWTIPASRAKMRREHRVPLPRQAVAILRDLHRITGRSKLVFLGYGTKGRAGQKVEPRSISENTLNGALRRLGFAKDEMTSHGFRAAASTLLNESGRWSPDAIERALAHVEENAVRRAYQRGEHWDERAKMAEWWADELDRLRKAQQ